jgi:hypothetical protein
MTKKPDKQAKKSNSEMARIKADIRRLETLFYNGVVTLNEYCSASNRLLKACKKL